MRWKQFAAVVICVAIVLAAYGLWYRATSVFNPNPSAATFTTSSCLTSSPTCPEFSVESANLTVKVVADIISQQLTVKVRMSGPSEAGRFGAYFSGIPIGNITETVAPGQSASVAWAIPTTINVTVGERYTVLIEAASVGTSATGGSVYWSRVDVVAV